MLLLVVVVVPAVSHPTWVRGLKQDCRDASRTTSCVAPYVGAWIETGASVMYLIFPYVAPYVGAWIETRRTGLMKTAFHVAPYVGAWIETYR